MSPLLGLTIIVFAAIALFGYSFVSKRVAKNDAPKKPTEQTPAQQPDTNHPYQVS